MCVSFFFRLSITTEYTCETIICMPLKPQTSGKPKQTWAELLNSHVEQLNAIGGGQTIIPPNNPKHTKLTAPFFAPQRSNPALRAGYGLPVGKHATVAFGNDKKVGASFDISMQSNVYRCLLSLTFYGDERKDDSFLDAVHGSLHAAVLKAVNIIMATSNVEGINTPFSHSDLTVYSVQKLTNVSFFGIRVSSSSEPKVQFLTDYIKFSQAGALNLTGVSGCSHTSATICKSRYSNPGVLLSFIGDRHVSTPVLGTMISVGLPNLFIEWIAQWDGAALTNGYSPHKGHVDVDFGSNPIPTNPDIHYIALVFPDNQGHLNIKDGAIAKGGWTFSHDKLKDSVHPHGAIHMTVGCRRFVAIRDSTPTTPSQPSPQELSHASEQARLALASALLRQGRSLGSSLVSAVPEDSMETDKAEEMSKAISVLAAAKQTEDIAHSILALIDSFTSAATTGLASTKLPVVETKRVTALQAMKDAEEGQAQLITANSNFTAQSMCCLQSDLTEPLSQGLAFLSQIVDDRITNAYSLQTDFLNHRELLKAKKNHVPMGLGLGVGLKTPPAANPSSDHATSNKQAKHTDGSSVGGHSTLRTPAQASLGTPGMKPGFLGSS